MTTVTYTNKTESASVIMDGECLACHRAGQTAIRRTTDGKFALVSTIEPRLIRVFTRLDMARTYQDAINWGTV